MMMTMMMMQILRDASWKNFRFRETKNNETNFD